MKKVDVSNISDPSIQQPFTGPSLSFLQEAYTDVITSIVGSFIGETPLAILILYGCVETDLGGSNFSYTKGAIWQNNEIFLVDAIASINIPIGQSQFKVVVTQDGTADPLVFTDNIGRNVHNIRKATIFDSGGPTPAEPLQAYVSAVLVGRTTQEKVIQIGDWNMDTTSTVSIAHGVSGTKIRSVGITIIKDNGTEYFTLNQDYGFTAIDDGNYSWDNTNIILNRFSTGFFDSTDFNSTSFNRGFITIKYIL